MLEKSKTVKIRKLSWDEIENYINNFCGAVKGMRFDYIVTLSRGGLIPSVITSHKLGIRELIIIRLKRTLSDDIHATKDAPEIEFNERDLKKINGKKILLVDDIVGSGVTLKHTLELLNKYQPQSITSFALTLSNTNYLPENPITDYIGEKVTEWIVFPWEKQNVE